MILVVFLVKHESHLRFFNPFAVLAVSVGLSIHFMALQWPTNTICNCFLNESKWTRNENCINGLAAISWKQMMFQIICMSVQLLFLPKWVYHKKHSKDKGEKGCLYLFHYGAVTVPWSKPDRRLSERWLSSWQLGLWWHSLSCTKNRLVMFSKKEFFITYFLISTEF